jgi:hypothetical protein
MANTKHINDTLYTLEREYGERFVLVTTRHVGSNVETGYLDVDKQNFNLKGIILPTEYLRKFFQDVGYLRANSNFTYGGLIDFKDVIIIVRKKWIPRGFEANLNHRVLYKGRGYDSVKVEELHVGVAYVFMLKHTEGELNYNVTEVKASDNLTIEELAGVQ